ncbi:MAG: hypothetical protein O8C66_08745 [Candidatus Methanoperedens sp.]|nr:hypothetical protein [Candidatus Methanoperedens sp.]MCZ7370583.1 hypothetical protein [Candidatus Methanoperedens sp.]
MIDIKNKIITVILIVIVTMSMSASAGSGDGSGSGQTPTITMNINPVKSPTNISTQMISGSGMASGCKSGTGISGLEVTVNGLAANIDASTNTFSRSISLSEGKNTVTVTAKIGICSITKTTSIILDTTPPIRPTPPPTTGSITVSTNLAGATFTLTGASSYSGSMGSWSTDAPSWNTANAPAGTYTITYGTVMGYDVPPSETRTLSAGGSIGFNGTYVTPVIADTTKGFEDDFNNKLLDSSMQVVEKVPGLGRYSLTDNPGYLRYYLEGSQGSMGGWRNNYLTSGAWRPSLTLIRPFDGENWTLRTKVDYNLHAHNGGSSTGAQGQSFWIAFGEGTNDYLSIYRGVDWWYKSNVLTMELVSNGVSVAKFSGAPSSIGTDGWVRESYWYEITRNGEKITVRVSNDGINYTTAFSALLTKPVTATQRAIIDMNLWNGAGSYVDWDYIHVVVLDGDSKPTITPTITATITPTISPTATPTITCKEPGEKFETAITTFREAEDKLKVAQAEFEPKKEQFKAELEAFESIKQSLTKEEKNAKKDELKRRGDELKLQGDKLQLVVKEFFERRIDLFIADIDLLKCDAKFTGNGEALPFDASATLDKHLMELEQIRTRVQQASDKQAIEDINRDLKDIKEKFELEKRYYKGIGVNNNMNTFFARTDDASVRMEILMKKLNENGKDTSKLAGIASDFNNLMNQAKETHNKTIDLFRDHSGFDSAGMVIDIRNAQDFIRQVREQQQDTQRLKDAIAELREFFGETNRLIQGAQAGV